MTLSELEAMIAEIRAEVGEDADPVVKMAVQPTYPFEWSVKELVVVNTTAEEQACFDNAEPDEIDQGVERPADDLVVYLVQGHQQEHLSVPTSDVWR